jgi:hypothetical protein
VVLVVFEVGPVAAMLLEERDDAVGGPGPVGKVVEGEEEGEVELVGRFEGAVEGGVVGVVVGGDVEREAIDVGGLGDADVGLPVGEGEVADVTDLGGSVNVIVVWVMAMDSPVRGQRLPLLPVRAGEPSTRPAGPRRGASWWIPRKQSQKWRGVKTMPDGG